MAKRFIIFHYIDGKTALIECEGEILGWFDSVEDVRVVRDRLNELYEENKLLKSNLKYQSALITMWEDYNGTSIEEDLWNLTHVESEEEFNELYKPYLETEKVLEW